MDKVIKSMKEQRYIMFKGKKYLIISINIQADFIFLIVRNSKNVIERIFINPSDIQRIKSTNSFFQIPVINPNKSIALGKKI